MVTSLLRRVFIWFDSLVYSLIGKAYELLMDIARIDILSNTTVDAFADRVYALLAIFMLFRLSFSILTYIINPDNSTDKSAGAGKLIGNVLITLVMLISAPWVFAQVRNLQSDLLEDNIVGKIILGTTTKNNANADGTMKDDYISNQLDPGGIMAWTTFEAFFQPTNENALENYSLEVNSEELNALDVWGRVKKSQSVAAIDKFGLSDLTDENGEYLFDYLPVISTIAGGFIAYILILFCFQIAVRSVKLSVLQLIAPIPIISYIDPKQGKDGMFKKWYKLCIKTFADLFIRLAAIYFAVFIINEFLVNFKNGDFADSNIFVKVMIILGTLMFAKELPKFIEEITGIKLSGGFSLSLGKTLASVPVAGALAARTMGGIDSKMHGNGFFYGLKQTDGVKLGGSKDKSIFDTYDRGIRKEVNKKRDMTRPAYEGKKDIKKIDEKWTDGEKFRKKFNLTDKMKDSSGKDYFDGSTLSNYTSAFKSEEFAKSKMNVDAADNKNKDFQKALDAARMGKADVTVNGKTYYLNGGAPGHTYEDLSDDATKAGKELKGKEEVHNAMRNVHQKDAELEDAIKFRKNNATNPTV